MKTTLILSYIVVGLSTLIGLTVHEAAHAFVAKHAGDTTASDAGRVTFNPLKHIDPVGTLFLPALLLFSHAGFLYGWAKPVPVKWSALGRPRRDMMLVAAAGPLANLALAALFMILLIASRVLVQMSWLTHAFAIAVITNLGLGVFNLLPMPPLDGSKVLAGVLPDKIARPYLKLGGIPFLPLVIVLGAVPLISFILKSLNAAH